MTHDGKGANRSRLEALAHTLAELLDKVSVRPEAGFEVQRQLTTMMADWVAKGDSAEGKALLQKAQGKTGMINASDGGAPMRDVAYRQLTEFKNELRTLARGE
jgi:DNA recombination-dependent growth factor C